MNKGVFFIVILVFLLALLSGCVTAEQCARRFPAELVRTDTVVREEIVLRDTLIEVPGDSVSVFIPCPEVEVPAPKYGRKTILTVEKTSQGVIVRCRVDTEKFRAVLKDKIRSTVISSEYTRTITVKKMSAEQKVFFYIGLGLVIYLVLKLTLWILSKCYPGLQWLSFIRRFI